MFQKKPSQVPKKESDDCEIEVRKTSSGKKIRFKGKCSKEELRIFSDKNELSLED